jgi:hypothetical protein
VVELLKVDEKRDEVIYDARDMGAWPPGLEHATRPL